MIYALSWHRPFVVSVVLNCIVEPVAKALVRPTRSWQVGGCPGPAYCSLGPTQRANDRQHLNPQQPCAHRAVVHFSRANTCSPQGMATGVVCPYIAYATAVLQVRATQMFKYSHCVPDCTGTADAGFCPTTRPFRTASCGYVHGHPGVSVHSVSRQYVLSWFCRG